MSLQYTADREAVLPQWLGFEGVAVTHHKSEIHALCVNTASNKAVKVLNDSHYIVSKRVHQID